MRGDHYVTLVVQVPTGLNGEQKELLKKFDEAMGGNKEETKETSESGKEKSKKKNFKDKINELFE